MPKKETSNAMLVKNLTHVEILNTLLNMLIDLSITCFRAFSQIAIAFWLKNHSIFCIWNLRVEERERPRLTRLAGEFENIVK